MLAPPPPGDDPEGVYLHPFWTAPHHGSLWGLFEVPKTSENPPSLPFPAQRHVPSLPLPYTLLPCLTFPAALSAGKHASHSCPMHRGWAQLGTETAAAGMYKTEGKYSPTTLLLLFPPQLSSARLALELPHSQTMKEEAVAGKGVGGREKGGKLNSEQEGEGRVRRDGRIFTCFKRT